jgi:hypothetical protein
MDLDQLEKRAYDLAMTLRQFGRLQIGRLFGSVRTTEGRYKATIDLLERCYFIRAEMNATTKLLLDKGIVTQAELLAYHVAEYELYVAALRKDWPEVDVGSAGFTVKDAPAFAARAKAERWPP